MTELTGLTEFIYVILFITDTYNLIVSVSAKQDKEVDDTVKDCQSFNTTIHNAIH